jgi:hypothetical protein
VKKNKVFSLGRVLDRRDKIYSRALAAYYDAHLVGETLRDICADILIELPQTVSRDALFESLRVLAGTRLTPKDAKLLAWRLAGNVDRLMAGEPVLPWTRQLRDEIVPVRVETIRAGKRKDAAGFTLSCRALAGTPCTLLFPQFVSTRSCRAISRTLGFSASRGRYPYSTPYHFVNLVFFAHIEAARSHETPYFKQVSCSSSFVKENRAKIEVRCRAKPCPRGFKHPCIKCWLGYNECPAGIYPRSLVERNCPQCAKAAFFEPDSGSLICINCRAAQQHLEQG